MSASGTGKGVGWDRVNCSWPMKVHCAHTSVIARAVARKKFWCCEWLTPEVQVERFVPLWWVVLNDEALKASIEEDNTQTCGELSERFQAYGETVRLPLYRIGKMYNLTKWVLHTLTEASKHQRVTACFWLLSRYHNVPIFNRVPTSDEKCILYDTSIPPLLSCKIMICIWWTSRQVAYYELLPMGQTNTDDLYSQ